MLINNYAYNFLSGEQNEFYHFQKVKGNHVAKPSQTPDWWGNVAVYAAHH